MILLSNLPNNFDQQALSSRQTDRCANLLELTTHSTRQKLRGVSISEEAGWVSNNLADVEVVTRVNTIGKDASLEGPSETTGGDTALIRASGVGESNTRRSRAALGCLVDVCRGQSHGLVGAGDAGESDVLSNLLASFLVEGLNGGGRERT